MAAIFNLLHNSVISVYIHHSSWKWIEKWIHGKVIANRVKIVTVWLCELSGHKEMWFLDDQSEQWGLNCWVSAQIYECPHEDKYNIWTDNIFVITLCTLNLIRFSADEGEVFAQLMALNQRNVVK